MKFVYALILFFSLTIAGFAQGAIVGTVTSLNTNETIVGATVMIQNTTLGTTTDLDGKFVIANVAPGLYNVQCSYLGYETKIIFEVEVTLDRTPDLRIQLQEVSVETGTVEIRGTTISNAEESPVSIRTIGANEIKRNPGGNRDISRAIRTLPGVAAIPSFRNDIIIRGGAANENRFYIDGIEIPNINHFATQGASGGPVGLINVDLVEEVEFYSGAFPAARGNALSSVMEFGFKNPRRDKFTANAVVGTSDLGITVEGPTGKNSGLVVSARRSYLQGLFSLFGLPFLPTYNDYNLKWKWDINDKNQLTIISLGAYDVFELNLKIANDTTSDDFLSNQYLLNNLLINNQWNYTFGAKWDHYRDKSRWTLVASRNMLHNEAYKHLNNDESLAKTLDYESSEQEYKLRLENKVFGFKKLKLLYGVNYERALFDNRSSFDEYIYFADTTVRINFNSAYALNKYGFFLQSSRAMLKERLVLSLGLRADGNDFGPNMRNPLDQLSPRLALKYSFAPQWSFNASTGIYYQQPGYLALGYQINGQFVNDNLKYIRCDQAVAGVQYNWDKRNSTISVEGFYKKYSNYLISKTRGISLANLGADFGTVGNEALESSGQGRTYGLEFLFQQKLFKGFYGILAYTLVRSEFTNANGQYAPSSWDSGNLISATLGKKFGKNWEIGGVFRFSGGLPFTPDLIDQSLYIPNWNALRMAQPDWNRINSERIRAFHQLDIRIDKKWYFPKWSLDLFFDVQNVYGQSTPLKPTLDVQRNAQGQPIVDPNNPNQYLPVFLDNSTGTVLPGIGVIIEL
jgi:outer membrane receptor for ferrienterochelin and colicin